MHKDAINKSPFRQSRPQGQGREEFGNDWETNGGFPAPIGPNGPINVEELSTMNQGMAGMMGGNEGMMGNNGMNGMGNSPLMLNRQPSNLNMLNRQQSNLHMLNRFELSKTHVEN